jgi:DnaJ-class molecular chaperone with C-terminal Zn finger domain
MENLYEILNINLGAEETEIKKAYVTMVRKYPPEKAPEEFKKIREAFEVLINPVSRAEYIARLQYGDDIEQLEKAANEATDNGNYAQAIIQYKKILIIEPNIAYIKNNLALALIYNGQVTEGIEQLLELTKENPKNSLYFSNLAYGYKQNGDLDKAEETLIKALELDNMSDKSLASLMDIYISKKDYSKATQYLIDGIHSNSSKDFREFNYYFELVRINTYDNNIEKIKETIDEVFTKMPDEEDLKRHISWRFYDLANDLYKNAIFDLATVITEKIIQLDKGNNSIINLYEECKELSHLSEEFKRLANDERILKTLKHPIYYYLYRFTFSNKQYEDDTKENLKNITESIVKNKKNIIKSLELLKKEYFNLYELKKEFYDDLYYKANNLKKR